MDTSTKPTLISFNHNLFVTPWVKMMSLWHNAIACFALQCFFCWTFCDVRLFFNCCCANIFVVGHGLMVGHHFPWSQHWNYIKHVTHLKHTHNLATNHLQWYLSYQNLQCHSWSLLLNMFSINIDNLLVQSKNITYKFIPSKKTFPKLLKITCIFNYLV